MINRSTHEIADTPLWNVAQSSAAEIMSELDLAIRLGYPGTDEAKALSVEYDEMSAMLATLIEQVKRGEKH